MKKNMNKIWALFFVLLIFGLGYFYLIKPEIIVRENKELKTSINTFDLGIDLVGGSQLVYSADLSSVKSSDIDDTMSALKTVLSKRLNPLGTKEVSIFIEKPSIWSENLNPERRVIIQIPGVSSPEDAKKIIGKTPILEFKLKGEENKYIDTGLNGRFLETANISYDRDSSPVVSLKFNEEGAKIFTKITTDNVGKQLAIFLDNKIISSPVIDEPIYSDSAIIRGHFTREDAKALAQNLKFGALPVKVKILSADSISPSLGEKVVNLSLKALVIGFITLFFILIYFYRLSGVLASIALLGYVVLTLSLFKLSGFVFTAAGIAGFIISIGMAVDANVLIFERIREELNDGKKIDEAIRLGFSRAWTSIRDGNLSSLFTAIVLFYTATSLIKGFSLTFGIGVLTSMFSAIVLTRIFLLSIVKDNNKLNYKKLFFGNIKLKK